MNFKARFLASPSDMDTLDDEVEKWHSSPEDGVSLSAHLGLSAEEYTLMVEDSTAFEQKLTALRKRQQFRFYQLEFSDEVPTKPYAFMFFEDKKIGL